MKDLLKRIAHHYGYEAQSRQIVEEMGELTVAINKHWRGCLACGKLRLEDSNLHSREMDAMLEEIADVEIMIEQMKILLNCEEEVELYKEIKVKRQLERMKKYE